VATGAGMYYRGMWPGAGHQHSQGGAALPVAMARRGAQHGAHAAGDAVACSACPVDRPRAAGVRSPRLTVPSRTGMAPKRLWFFIEAPLVGKLLPALSPFG
jgi:hypothetical protein